MDPTSPDGFQSWCRACMAEIRHQRDQFTRSESALVPVEPRPAVFTRQGRAPRVHASQFAEMVRRQHGLCALCGAPESFKDEDGKVMPLTVYFSSGGRVEQGGIRGAICRRCTIGLMMFLDSPSLLAKAISFLTRTSPESALATARIERREPPGTVEAEVVVEEPE